MNVPITQEAERRLREHMDGEEDDASALCSALGIAEQIAISIGDDESSSPVASVRAHKSPLQRLRASLRELLLQHSLPLSLLSSPSFPRKWEQLGDLVLLPHNAFESVGLGHDSADWGLGPVLWRTVADALKVSRVARQVRLLLIA